MLMDYNEINSFFDDFGTLDKKIYVDGGDSCQRAGMYDALLGMMKGPIRARYPRNDNEDAMRRLKLHHPAPGYLIRHPNPEWDASDWDRDSIDQRRPWMIAAGIHNRKELWSMFWAHGRRSLWLFCGNRKHNGATKSSHGEVWKVDEDGTEHKRDYRDKTFPDPCGPEVFGIYIRGLNLWMLYPLLWIFDIQTFLSALQNRFSPTQYDIINNATIVLYGRYKFWTPWMWLAHKVHDKQTVLHKVMLYFLAFQPGGQTQMVDMVFFVDMFKDAYESVD